jgi:release factor glutamine methyltransferase
VNIREISTQAKSEWSGLLPDREVDAVLSLLFEFRLGWNRTQQIIRREDMLDPDMIDILNEDIQQIRKGRPVQHITGIGWFMDMPFKVSGDVLIPRPETEELVLASSASLSKVKEPVILDLCTGSGCIAISIKKIHPESHIRAVDVSEKALQIAKENEAHLLGGPSIEWKRLDVLESACIQGDEDLVISNPPYIPLNESDALDKNVRDYEPHIALFTPSNDPLQFYRVIGDAFAKVGKPGASLWFECHEDYSHSVADYLKTLGLQAVEIHCDMQKKPRMVWALKG